MVSPAGLSITCFEMFQGKRGWWWWWWWQGMARDRRKAEEVEPVLRKFALAHYANHPPTGVQPNVAAFPVDFNNADTPRSLLGHVPLVSFRKPAANDALLHGLVLVATTDINAGAEIFLDYKFTEKDSVCGGTLPAWYSPVQPQTRNDAGNRSW